MTDAERIKDLERLLYEAHSALKLCKAEFEDIGYYTESSSWWECVAVIDAIEGRRRVEA